MHEKSISAIASTFPLTLRNGTLEVQDLKVVSRQFSPIDQYNALMREGTLQEAVKGTLILKDKEGKVVDTAKNFTLVHVPHLTERHTLIMGGNEYQVANQLRRKPGVYTSRADNGELRAIFNLGRGSNFNLGFTPDKGTFHVQLGTSNIPLYPVLRAAGVSHETIAHHLGDAVAKANQTYHGKEEEKATGKLYAKLEHPALFKADLPHAEKVEAIRKKWDVTTLDPHVTEATLGTAYSKVTPEALLTAARKVLDVHAGHKTTDDTDALTYKTFHSLDDFLHERIKLTARAWGPKAKLALATKGTIREALRPAPFSDGVRKFITTGSLAAVPTAINPLELIDHAVKVTSLGEGGIPSDRAIPLDARMIHNTHFGALDPIRTPECFPPDVEVCTERGWVRWDTVRDTDCFLSVVDSVRAFRLAERVVREPYEGLMCSMTGAYIDCVVTPNHRVYGRATEFYEISFVQAWEIQGAVQWYFPTEDPSVDYVYEPKLRTSVEPYRGLVYCATVPGGLLYVRRNGCTPYWTGNSSHSGVDIRATIAAHRDEAGNMYTVATNVKTKQPEYLRAGDLRKYILAFPGEELKGTVDAIKNGRVERVPASTVTHQIAHTSHLYSPATTLLPLIHGMQGNRAIMASKMGTQALPLIEREAPFVQSKSHLPGEISFEAVYGHMIAPRAPVSGKVVKIEDGWIYLKPHAAEKKAEDYTESCEGRSKTAVSTDYALKVLQDAAERGDLTRLRAYKLQAAMDALADRVEAKYPVGVPYPENTQRLLDVVYALRERTALDHTPTAAAARAHHRAKTHAESHTLAALVQANELAKSRPQATLSSPPPTPPTTSREPQVAGSHPPHNHALRNGVAATVALLGIGYGAKRLYDHMDAEKKAEDRHIRPEVVKKASQDVRHIFVTGHSGAGKSTYAKRLSTETGLPVHRLDDAPGLLAARKLGDTPTAERLSREAVAHSLTLATPHIIEGTSALLAPEHMAGHRVVLMDAPREDILNARLQREVAQAAVRGVGEDVARRQAHGANIYDYYAPRVDALRQLPNVEVRAPGYVPTVKEAAEFVVYVEKTAEDRPTVKVRSFGPFKFHIEIPKGAKPFGDPFPCDYGYLPGYVGPDGDSLDFWVGTDADGALVSVDTEEKNASDVWVKRDTKYIVGVAADDVHIVLTQIERKPKTRCVNRRNYTSWEALTKSIEHFKDEEDHVEKTAATKDDGLIRVPYSQNFPFPSKTSLNHTLSVKPGDTVVAGQRMGDSNYTKDGVLALGRNLRVAYVPYYGLNSNDAVVISEACAKKLTSEHVYREVFSIPVGMEFSKERHQFYYGTKYSPAQYAVLDTHGVIKKGVRVSPKDLLVCGLVKTQVVGTDAILGRISKALAKPYQEVALTWNHGTPGEVIDVVRTGSQIAVLVKTIEQMQVGDKLAGRHGNKGVVAKILPDHEMLKDEAGNTLDLLLTSAGVISRINPSQVLETSLGKVVEKTGKPIIFDNNTPRNLEAWTAEQLKKHGIKDKEHLYDPILKRHIKGADGEGVFVGRQFIYKLFKSTDTNFSGHGVGPYDLNEQPLKTGGEESAKGIGKMEFDALIAHNARNFLREASALKGQKNDEFWRAIQLGLPLPAAKSPFAFKKFVGMLEGAGLKVDQRGSKFQLLPMTDKDIVARSTGAIKKPETLIAKNLRPEPGGLFDARLTGGPQGTLYSHIDLHEPIPHPVFKEPVRRLLGLTEKGFDEKLRAHGGTWFYNELKALDTDQKLKDLHVKLKTAKGADLNDTVKQIKYLDALNAHGYKPHDAYVVSKVPVVPPVFRPIIPQPNNPGELMVADANKLYMHVMDSNHTLKNTALESDIGKHRRQVFNAVAALYGTEDVENDELRGQSVKGFLSNIAGVGTPKGGFFQRKVIRKTQDVSGRGTAVPDPTLGMDNVGIPEQMLWQMYDKLIIARMVRQGHTALEAKEAVLKKTPAAKAVLMQEIGERPVMINRAPTLHRWSIVAAYPVPVQGKTIRVNPFIEKGLNLDYDGDNQDSTVILIMAKPPLGGCHNRGSYLDFTTDSATVVLPGDLRLPRMEEHMAARFRSEVPALINQELVLCDLANFPHGEQISQKGHITFYAVPENVSILALDEATGRVCVQHPTLWSRHTQRERYIITLGSERQIFSDDDPRAVYGLDSDLNYIRRRPSESVGVFVPVSYGALGDGSDAPFETLPATDTSPVFPLTEEAGHLIGMMIGNGTVEPYRLRLAGMNKGIQTQFRTVLPSLFPEVALKFAVYGHDASGGFGDSEVTCVTSEPGTLVASRFHGMFGHGAENKHLPTWFLRTSYAFRRGLLAGLIDTDGSVSVSHGKKKPQWMVNYSSRSGRLAREIVLLAQSLGLRAKVTAAKTPLGDPHYVVNFSTVELGRFGALPLVHTEKVVKFREFQADPPEANSSYNATNLVPVPATIAKQLSRLFKSGGSDYAKWYQSIKKGYVARAFAEETLALHPTLRESEDTLLHRWITLVDNKTIRWDQVTAFQKTGITEDGYDLTVPGYETFMNVEGVILSNTLQVHAPVTHDAIADAKKMTLSNMLLADNTRNKILAFPQHEAIIGFTHGSKLAPSNKPIQHFKTMDEAIAAYKRGALAANDRIEIP